MMKQMSLTESGFVKKPKATRRQLFLGEMERVVPWGRLCMLIEPHYPKVGAKGGRPPKCHDGQRFGRCAFPEEDFRERNKGVDSASPAMSGTSSLALRRFENDAWL